MKTHGITQGKRVTLRPATPEDEPQSPEMAVPFRHYPVLVGTASFREQLVPESGDSSKRLDPHYLDGTAPELGRCFLVVVDSEPVGQLTYHDIVERDGRRQIDLDIWMRSEAYCGKGYGTDALDALCGDLHEKLGVSQFMVQPSSGNPRVIRAYEKV